MGTKVAPTYAAFLLEYLEEQLFKKKEEEDTNE